MKFIERITGLITNPDKTMEDVAKEPRIEEAAVIIAAYAILAAISAYITSTHVKYIYTNLNGPDMSGITMIISIIAGLLSPFIMWIIVSVLLYLFSMVFGGEGKFGSVMTAIGYSGLVKILAAIVAILLLTQAPNVTVEINSSNPFGGLTGLADYTKSAPVMLSNIVILLGVLWSSFIGIFGIKHTEKLSLRNAAIVVGVPLAIYVLIQLSTLLL